MNENEQFAVIARGSRLIEWSPDVPTDPEVARIAARARRIAGSAGRSPVRRWQVAAALALVAGVAALAVVLSPGHPATPAFAQERALSALTFHVAGRVTHMQLALTMKSRGAGSDPRDDVDQRWSIWVDADGTRVREECVNTGDGSLEELSVQAGSHMSTLLTGPRYEEAHLVESGLNRPVTTTVDQWVNDMRSMISEGIAKVTGTTMVDGEEYWVVENKADSADGGGSVETLTMRTSDYRVGTWSMVSTSKLDSGTVVTSKLATLQILEQLDPGSVPADFFSLDSVRAAARAAGAKTP